jgi:hypothetical protein
MDAGEGDVGELAAARARQARRLTGSLKATVESVCLTPTNSTSAPAMSLRPTPGLK